MDLQTGWQQLTAQGPLFWAAAVSVALGVALLAAAAAVNIRRRRPQMKPRTTVRATATGYKAEAVIPPRPAAVMDDGLAPRLAAAADRLAAIHADLTADRTDHSESGLKAPLAHVEYVFKSGEA